MNHHPSIRRLSDTATVVIVIVVQVRSATAVSVHPIILPRAGGVLYVFTTSQHGVLGWFGNGGDGDMSAHERGWLIMIKQEVPSPIHT